MIDNWFISGHQFSILANDAAMKRLVRCFFLHEAATPEQAHSLAIMSAQSIQLQRWLKNIRTTEYKGIDYLQESDPPVRVNTNLDWDGVEIMWQQSEGDGSGLS